MPNPKLHAAAAAFLNLLHGSPVPVGNPGSAKRRAFENWLRSHERTIDLLADTGSARDLVVALVTFVFDHAPRVDVEAPKVCHGARVSLPWTAVLLGMFPGEEPKPEPEPKPIVLNRNVMRYLRAVRSVFGSGALSCGVFNGLGRLVRSTGELTADESSTVCELYRELDIKNVADLGIIGGRLAERGVDIEAISAVVHRRGDS